MSDAKWYEQTMTEHERRTLSKAWKERMADDVVDVMGAASFMLLMVLGAWLYACATPYQSSAENDLSEPDSEIYFNVRLETDYGHPTDSNCVRTDVGVEPHISVGEP